MLTATPHAWATTAWISLCGTTGGEQAEAGRIQHQHGAAQSARAGC
jgi:hypothetical protein